MGILEILGINSKPRGVKIRYKLVQNQAGEASPAAKTSSPLKVRSKDGTVQISLQSTPPKNSFGPVFACALDLEDMGFVDLDSNKLVKGMPKELAEKTYPDKSSIFEQLGDGFDYMRQERLDLLYTRQDEVVAADMILKELSPSDWNELGATQLIGVIQRSATNSTFPKPLKIGLNSQATYGFQTREGGLGLLQVTGFTEHPRGVTLRYKLVQAKVPAPPINPVSPLTILSDGTKVAVPLSNGTMTADSISVGSNNTMAAKNVRIVFRTNEWKNMVLPGKADQQVQPANVLNEVDLTLAAQPPVVVETFPVSNARDVAPGETEIRVRFSKLMTDGSWSWTDAWENSAPELIGQPHYAADGRTCVVKAKLEPGRTYALWLNSEQFQNFTDQTGHPAVPYLLIFQTKQK